MRAWWRSAAAPGRRTWAWRPSAGSPRGRSRPPAGPPFPGTDVADWLQAARIAIVSKTPVELLWQAVPPFPTRSEIWLKLLERREADLAAQRSAQPQWELVAPTRR